MVPIHDIVLLKRWQLLIRSFYALHPSRNGFAPESSKGFGALSIAGCRYSSIDSDKSLGMSVYEVFSIGRSGMK